MSIVFGKLCYRINKLLALEGEMPVLGTDTQTHNRIELTKEARRQGLYVIGTTGTGKTTLLQNIAVEDMKAGEGLCVLYPHGDLTDELLMRVPKDRWDDVILFDPVDLERPFGLNLLECDRNDPVQVRWVVSTLIGTLHRLFSFSWGPRLEHVLRHSLLTAMTLDHQATMVELLLLLTSEDYRKKVIPKLEDYMLVNFWDTFPKSERLRYELISSTLNKISPFLTDVGMRNIVGQQTNSFDMQTIMDEGKILFVNLSKGDLGEDNSALLGSVLVNLILMGSLRRRSIPYEQRRPFHLIVDEYQNFATESFAVLQSEARKYAVDVIVAHQFRDQLDDLNRGSTLNVANFVVMRVSGKDSFELASQFDNTPPEP
ncbi:MAG: type IV secretion system DNA-binding domain-containing protein, partial [Chloroflexi bacterium]|nr:type IV secretion system DNA-binding domain-containing protein [Chloroflexota bacterium]